ncbi:glycosyl hydrolase family 18 protein [Brevibacillus marinus]|uniref:glycosyl hydrolase family 18 protein n=1 Tax=Brevibacillus marinus TaxID=2496837 RepID=UPI000F82B799|nr:S-layer homology domain-containing protein [Brevibacillus marinus]
MQRKTLFLAALLLLSSALPAYAYDVDLRPFSDVDGSDWAKEAIYSLAALGHVSGYPDQTFRPAEQVSREAFVKMLVGVAQLPDAGGGAPRWNDVDAARWSYPFFVTANQHGLLAAFAQGQELAPQQAITREKVAAMVGMYLLNQAPDAERSRWLAESWQSAQQRHVFSDQQRIDARLAPYVYYAISEGVMQGDSSGAFRPQDGLSRREAAALLYRLSEQQADKVPLEVLGFYAISSYGNLDKAGYLDRIAFGWAELEYQGNGQARLRTDQGTWKIPEGWQEVVDTAERLQLKNELMVFANQPELAQFLQDEAARASFVASLTALLADERYGFGGVCIDFEGLRSAASRDAFTSFLEQVKRAIGERSLTVAVPPTVYYQGYDLRAIGQTADAVVLMAYDFTDQANGLPSAPLALVNDAVTEALRVIPKEKLLLGISKQANQWVTTGNGLQYYQPAINMVEARLQQPGTTATFSVPYFLQEIRFADERGTHQIWYEDEQSIAKKIWLAKYHGLRGIALWHMGSFTPDDWQVVAQQQ